MKGYSEKEIFSLREQCLARLATEIVSCLPDDAELRCHELARAIGHVLGLQFQDGFYGFVDHTWLWTDKFKKTRFWKLDAPRILDVYSVGSLPQVRLLDVSSNLPHVGWAYRPGDTRRDINKEQVTKLIELVEEMEVAVQIKEAKENGVI